MDWETLNDFLLPILDVSIGIEFYVTLLSYYFINKFPELKEDFKLFRISEIITLIILVVGILFGMYMKFVAFVIILASIGCTVSIGFTLKMYVDYRKLKKL